MSISNRAKHVFETLTKSARNYELCLIECDDRKTGKKVNVICRVENVDGVATMKPLGKLFRGNPFNEVTPPGVSAPKLI